MDWILSPWLHWMDLGPAPTLSRRCHDEAGEAGEAGAADPGQRRELTALDLWLIRLAYEVVAAESACARCGAPLGRRIRLVAWAVDHPAAWTVSIVTRCSGWRRHRHVARVDDGTKALLLGPLRPR
jgi:hypothetical protein